RKDQNADKQLIILSPPLPARRVHELSRVTQQKTTVCLWDSESACTRTSILQVGSVRGVTVSCR
ncbi:MAG: hypothetical protein WC078_04905, partial [Dysgonamonadaceae bacterium]